MDLGVSLIVIAGMGAWYSLKSKGVDPLSRRRTSHRDDSAGPGNPLAGSTAREAELEGEVEQLRSRIQVLERIATDGRHSRELADEIESLRER